MRIAHLLGFLLEKTVLWLKTERVGFLSFMKKLRFIQKQGLQ